MAERVEQVQRAFTAYIVERELGSGGMATVYLAHDKKHDRKVAIKILHAELAAMLGAERFLQEIRVTANLQHPHILGLIDSGLIGDNADELKGRPYYVMPYLEGESLRQRLDKEQELPVSDSVRIATEVASALDYAHRHNVIHRDIKPENILLHDGSAIVADFGIALAVTQAGGERITQSGVSLGTPTYMSPEQAVGERALTGRSDIYSLGVVTYEMLSGEPPFKGPSARAVAARVMTEEPRSLTTLRRNVPPHVAAAVSRAIEKIPADRFASAHEFAEALNNASFTLSPTSATLGRDRSIRRLRWMLYGVTALAILTTGTSLWGWLRPAPPKQVVRYNLALDSAEAMAPGASWWSRIAISPDASTLAYIGGPHAEIMILRRDQLHATPIQGTAGAETPFFSPDGQQLGALTEQRVHIAAIDGGQAITVSDTLTGVAGASWGRDGFIYVDGQGPNALLRVEAKAGSVPKWFTVLDTARGEIDHTWPDVLPNGKGVLFTVAFTGKNAVKAGTTFAIAVAEIPSGKHRVIVNDAKFARYAAGHLLYVTTNKTLMVVPFDQNSMQIVGKPRPLVEGMRLGDLGAADLAVSETGTLVYATGAGEGKRELVWVTRDGKAQPVDPNWQGTFGSPALKPDGRQLAVSIITNEGRADIWTKQLDNGPIVNLTLDGKGNFKPTWTPDGRSVTFESATAGTGSDLRTKRADGSANAVLQFHGKRDVFQPLWSPDGKWLIFVDALAPGTIGIFGIRPGIDTAPVPLVASKVIQVSPALSRDGRWLAYDSNESGIPEVYVVPFPNTGTAKWAAGGGTEPRWSHSGKELFYRDASGRLVTVEVKTRPTFSLGRSTPLFPAAEFVSDPFARDYDVSLDDRRFLMIRPVAANAPNKLIVVENWFEELKAKSRK